MKREKYIDIAKGLAIWCIVLLHYENGLFSSEVNAGISYFMVSMFYVTSGWLQGGAERSYALKSFIHKRWKQLGIPYLWWSAIILTFDIILFLVGYYDVQFLAKEVYKTFTLRGIGTLWFLPALFLGEIFWIFIREKLERLWRILIALLLVGYCELYIVLASPYQDTIARIIDAPFRTLNNAANATICIAIAELFRRCIWPKLTQLPNISLFLIGLMTYVLSYAVCSEGLLFVRVISFATAALGVLLIVYSIQHFSWVNFLSFWGRNSLNLMITHYSFVMVLWDILVVEVLHEVNGEWWALLGFACSIPLQYALVLLLNKKYPQLFGKVAKPIQ